MEEKEDEEKMVANGYKGKFKKQSKAESGKYLSQLATAVYDGTGDAREHIMKMTNMAMKLRDLNTEIFDSYLVWQVLESLPSEFDVLKTSYNTQGVEWTLDQMTAIVVQEEEIIHKSKKQSAHMVTHSYKGTDVGKNMQTQEFAFEEERLGNSTSSTSLDIVIPPFLEHHDESLFEQDDVPLPVIDEP
ncbi:hypothetical protein QYF36_019733 [Acer negundo]|nr:hypothetical protein QYF36_019733 [Acer negundo]